MMIIDEEYDPVGTKTFEFFGNPQVRERMTPVVCFMKDVWNVGTHFRLIPAVLTLFKTIRPIDELYIWAPTFLSLIWFSWWSAILTPFVLSGLALSLAAAAIITSFIKILDVFLWRIIQGPQLQVYPPQPPPGYNERQRWIYFNGIATGKTITKQNLQCLSETFHNPVLAVNNRTYGLWSDLVECIIQRAFGYRTKETGIAYEIIKDYLIDYAHVDKVILIAHSQGGIIASQILDDLYCSLSRDELARMEVYTFGSAALTCNNPWRDKYCTTRVIPVMEHYCNERDMVTSWGALASADRKDLPFQGKVFVFQGQTGHMLNQHYLSHMFPGPQNLWKDMDFLLRAVERDPDVRDKFYVTGKKAVKGDKTVQTLSHLWKYL